MRKIDEIRADLRVAAATSDIKMLSALADELKEHPEPGASALERRITGTVHRLKCEYDLALSCYEQSLALCEEAGERTGVANAVVQIGNVHWELGRRSEALAWQERACQLYEDLGDHGGMLAAIGNIGSIHATSGAPAEALIWFTRSYSVCQDRGDKHLLAVSASNIGSAYGMLGDYVQALEWNERALERYEQSSDPRGVARALGNIGMVYIQLNEHERAMSYFERAVTGYSTANDRANTARMYGNLGIACDRSGRFDEALTYHHMAGDLYKSFGHEEGVIGSIISSISTLLHAGQYDEAQARHAAVQLETLVSPTVQIDHLGNGATLLDHNGNHNAATALAMQALDLAHEHGLRGQEMAIHKFLRDLAQKRSDLAAYIKHNDEYGRLTEELRGQEAMRKLTMIEAEKQIESERREKERHKALLYNTLPPDIADRVLRGESVNDSFELATVMFTDMVGFTRMSAAMRPDEVVTLLNQIYTSIDDLITRNGLMKIKTIGDSYMAVAIPASGEEGSDSVVIIRSAALAAVQLRSMMRARFPELQVRIGLHCGPISAGVIGTERLQYDVWGDTVNVASRMESHGEPGRIHVSEAFAAALGSRLRGNDEEDGGHDDDALTAHRPPLTGKDSLTLIKRGAIDIKGKGPMITYWLEST